LAQLQLAFVIFINVQNFSSLLAFKRLLILLTRSECIFRKDDLREEGGFSRQSLDELYLLLLRTLAAELQSLPETFFTVDLEGTGMQDFWREELQALCSTLTHGRVGTPTLESTHATPMREAVSRLRKIAEERFQWTLKASDELTNSDDEPLEEGEDAPIVVDM
jgi:A1 cistron-splicing factor AAR2